MKLLYKLLLFTLVINLISCAKYTNEVSKIKEINQEAELINTYKEGIDELEEENYFVASTKFLEAELLFPQSIWAPKSALMASYSYYMMDNYSSARLNLERYIKTYPKHKDIVYAQYLLEPILSLHGFYQMGPINYCPLRKGQFHVQVVKV